MMEDQSEICLLGRGGMMHPVGHLSVNKNEEEIYTTVPLNLDIPLPNVEVVGEM
jgi:hypothetical protein